MEYTNAQIKNIIKENYTIISKENNSCCSCQGKLDISNEELTKLMGYNNEEISNVPEANMGLGCGNPLAFSEIKKGDKVLDLGCGGGFDVFLAAKKVGNNGKAVGIDMTESMIEKATQNAKKYNYNNVEFFLGEIENLPFEDNIFDLIISNCVINLSTNKDKVFEEAYRVLRKDGTLSVSDIVLLEELTKEQKNNEKLISGCIAGALLKEDYIDKIKKAGFEIINLNSNKKIKEHQYKGFNLESLKVIAKKT
jgi:ArsR family transcriptional regulator